MKIRMSDAFTMVELIFIIVIIGILAVTAVPRLMATRMDAKMSARAHDIAVAANEIVAYAISRGSTETNLTKMSNALKSLVARGEGTPGHLQVKINAGKIRDCATIKIEQHGSNTEILKLTYGATSDDHCDVLRDLINEDDYPVPMRGRLIVY